jgi:membrane protein implicated in regulation of membrane protease activity
MGEGIGRDLKERDRSGQLGFGTKVILKWMLEKWSLTMALHVFTAASIKMAVFWRRVISLVTEAAGTSGTG